MRPRRGGRVVDRAALEMRSAARHRGFESLPLRHLVSLLENIGGTSPSVFFEPDPFNFFRGINRKLFDGTSPGVLQHYRCK